MRQAGILAAAGIVALETMVDRLEEDHQRAQLLADKLRNIPNMHVRANSPQTNMVFIDLDDSDPRTNLMVIEELKNMGVLIGTSKNRGFRLVTHYGISDDDIGRVSDTFLKIMAD
jgi:threonine aldolase